MTETIERRAIEWAIGDDVGSSSKALCAWMLGISGVRHTPPLDASDRGRCIRLLKLIPEWLPRLDEMARVEKPQSSLVFGAGGMRTETNSWAKQIPLILKEGNLKWPMPQSQQ